MKKRNFLLAIILTASAGIGAKAQTAQISAFGSYLKGTGDNEASLWGGGVAGKGYIGDRIALGLGIQTYPKRTTSAEVGSYKYNHTDLLTNASASVDLLLRPKQETIQPYLGVDGGLSWNSHTVTYANNQDQYIQNENKQTYFLLSPKAGINIGLTQAFGIFGQVRYNFTFGDGNSTAITDVPNPFKSEPVTKFFNVDAGIYFRLMPAR